MSVRCGNRIHSDFISAVHHHATVAQVKLCCSRANGLPSFEDEAAFAEAEQEIEVERRMARFWAEGPHGSTYAGSEEEARDRWLEGLYDDDRVQNADTYERHIARLL